MVALTFTRGMEPWIVIHVALLDEVGSGVLDQLHLVSSLVVAREREVQHLRFKVWDLVDDAFGRHIFGEGRSCSSCDCS